MHETYKGILVESESEIMVLDWLFELKDRGFIHSIERTRELIVSLGLENKYIKKTIMKTKVKEEPRSQIILSPHHYTPEFSVVWYADTPKGLLWPISNIGLEVFDSVLIGHHFPILIENPLDDTRRNGFLTYIEVKPDYDYQNMSRLFRINQKWMWESRKMFINLLEPKTLYKGTFTPLEYLKTRKKKTEREIKWKVRTVDEYLQSIGYEIPREQETEGQTQE